MSEQRVERLLLMLTREIKTTALKRAADFAAHWDEIHNLRKSLDKERDILFDPLHFLTATDETRRSCSLLCWRGATLVGLFLATEHYVFGIRTGFAVGGDFSGRGLLLCSLEEEQEVLSASVKRLALEGVHSLHLRYFPASPHQVDVGKLRVKCLNAIIPGDRMCLGATFDEFLSGLGKHTRRNARASRRKAEAAGIHFVSGIHRKDYLAAVQRLNVTTDFPADDLHLERDERLIKLHVGERHCLKGPDGRILAVLSGFRSGGRFHLLTQLNDETYERYSLSLVLRAYTIEYLIGGGIGEIQFMGGSSLVFGRYCQPENYRSLFIDKRWGLAAVVKTLSAISVGWLQRLHLSIPQLLTEVSSGYLHDSALIDRTALKPASVLFGDRQGNGI